MSEIIEDAVFTGLVFKRLEGAPKMLFTEREQFFQDIEEEVHKLIKKLDEEYETFSNN